MQNLIFAIRKWSTTVINLYLTMIHTFCMRWLNSVILSCTWDNGTSSYRTAVTIVNVRVLVTRQHATGLSIKSIFDKKVTTKYCIVLLRSSRSISRSRSSSAIERDRNRDLSYSIFADFRWVMASMCNHQGHYMWCARLWRDWSATQWNDVGRRSIPPLPHACQTAGTACLWNGTARTARGRTPN